MKLGVIKLYDGAIIPTRGSAEASGLDLYSYRDVVLSPGEKVLIGTGIALDIPKGYEIQIRPRSGMSLKTDFVIVNSPGTIDSDYQGEIKIIGKNNGSTPMMINSGDRIAQAIMCPIIIPEIVIVEKYHLESSRSLGGFGSTGV